MNKNVFKLVMIAMLLIIASVNVKAQWFLGGEVGVNVNSKNFDAVNDGNNDSKQTFDGTNIGFKIAPKFGYYFNEKVALGLSFSVGGTFSEEREKKEYIMYSQDFEYRKNSVNWGVYPFVRYSVFTYKKFSVLLEGYTGVGCAHGFGKLNGGKEKSTTVSIGVFNVTPILSFKFNDRLQIETGLRFLNVGYNIDISKGEFEGDNSRPPNSFNQIKHDFNIGFNSGSVFSLSQTIGIIYKFKDKKQ